MKVQQAKEENQSSSSLFGIPVGQKIEDINKVFIRKAQCYNEKGEKILWGDLTYNDINIISDKIDPQQALIIIYDPIPSFESDNKIPLHHLIRNARFIITKERCSIVIPSKNKNTFGFIKHTVNGISFTVITSTQLLEIIHKSYQPITFL